MFHIIKMYDSIFILAAGNSAVLKLNPQLWVRKKEGSIIFRNRETSKRKKAA